MRQIATGGDGTSGQTGQEVLDMFNENFQELYSTIEGLVAGAGAAAANRTLINSALAGVPSGQRLIIPLGYWHLSGPIDLTAYNKNIRLDILGDLQFASGQNGIVAGGNTIVNTYTYQEVNVFGTLYGANAGTTYDSFSAGVGFTIKNHTNGMYLVNSAEGWLTALQIEASGASYTGSLHNHLRFGVLDRNHTGLVLTCTGEQTNFVNQNYIYGGIMSGKNGVRFVKNSAQVDPFNNNMFYGISTENIVTGDCWNIDFAENNVFINGRTMLAENATSADRFKFSSTASFNKVIGYVMDSTDIDDAGKFNDFRMSRIVDNATTEETGMYYDWANKRLALGRTDENHFPYFMPQANLDLRGNGQIRQDRDYDYAGEDTFLYLGGGNVVSDNAVEKGYAVRIKYTDAATPSELLIYGYDGFDSTDRFKIPTTDLNLILKLSEGKLTVTQYLLSALNAAPASASDTGTTGEIRITAGFLYVCTATDTWVRTALATWP